MENIESTVAAIKAKAESDIAKAIAWANVQETVTRALDLSPENWTPGAMHPSSGDCFLVFKVDSLNDALVMAERADSSPGGLPVVILKDSCTSFKPEAMLKPKEIEKAENNDSVLCDRIAPYIYNVNLNGGRPEKYLKFWRKVESYVVEFRVYVANDPLTYIQHVAPVYDHRNRQVQAATTRIVNQSGHFSHTVKWYSSDISYSHFTLYSY